MKKIIYITYTKLQSRYMIKIVLFIFIASSVAASFPLQSIFQLSVRVALAPHPMRCTHAFSLLPSSYFLGSSLRCSPFARSSGRIVEGILLPKICERLKFSLGRRLSFVVVGMFLGLPLVRVGAFSDVHSPSKLAKTICKNGNRSRKAYVDSCTLR